MELNWTTLVLEIINFLVLVWLLKRFFYRPVQAAIERRRASIEEDLANAAEKTAQADELLQQRQQQLDQLRQKRQQAEAALETEIAELRVRKQNELQKALAVESQRRGELESHRQAEQSRQLEKQALQLGGRFASQMLSRFASQELQNLIVQVFVDDLKAMPQARRSHLQESLPETPGNVKISSAFELQEEPRQQVMAALQELAGGIVLDPEYCVDPALICGLQIEIDAMVLQASLKRELSFFSEAEDAG